MEPESRPLPEATEQWNGVTIVDPGETAVAPCALLTDYELYLHGEGTNHESYRTLGAHLVTVDSINGVRFAVWAPNAETVSVIGDFNRWDRARHPMCKRDGGVWEVFVPGIGEG